MQHDANSDLRRLIMRTGPGHRLTDWLNPGYRGTAGHGNKTHTEPSLVFHTHVSSGGVLTPRAPAKLRRGTCGKKTLQRSNVSQLLPQRMFFRGHTETRRLVQSDTCKHIVPLHDVDHFVFCRLSARISYIKEEV